MASKAASDESPAGWRRWFRETARPPAVRDRADAHWLVVATVCLGAFMGQLDASIVTVVLPTLQRHFHSTTGAVQWVALTYLLVLAVALPMVGRLADMLGRKLLYTNGFVLFILGSALCGLAPSLLLLDAFRVLQALGAAMMQANSVAIIVAAMPKDKLGRGLGVQGAAQAVGLALGPVLGGLLISLGGWRLIFFVNVPVGIAGTVLGRYLIPRSRDLSRRAAFDWGGLATLVPAVGPLFVALSMGNTLGWGSAAILGMFAGSAAFFVLFVWREGRAAAPMVQLALLRIRAFTVGVAKALLIYTVLFGTLSVTPFYLERALHASASRTGLELLTVPAALGLAAPFAGRLADRWGARPMVIGGMTLAGAALAGLALAHQGAALLLLLALVGVGVGISTSPNNAATVGAAPRTHSGVASGVLNMSRGLGTAMGLSVALLIYDQAAGAGTSPVLASAGFAHALVFLAITALVTVMLTVLADQGGTLAGAQFTLE